MENDLQALGFDSEEVEEILTQMEDETDFEYGTYRFISDEVIDDVLFDEMSGDEYLLGCFASWVIADATGWPIALIEAAQKGEAFDEIGEAMTEDHIRNLVKLYVSEDGYGHHFATYDGEDNEIGDDWHAFRVN